MLKICAEVCWQFAEHPLRHVKVITNCDPVRELDFPVKKQECNVTGRCTFEEYFPKLCVRNGLVSLVVTRG